MKQLILLATASSYRVRAFEQAADRLGIPVTRAEDVPPPLLGRVDTPLPLDYQDVPRAARLIEEYAREHPVGAVVGLDDSGTLIAAAASQRLGLPFNDPESALAARNKAIMRKRFLEAGVPSPNFAEYRLGADMEKIAAGTVYPCVLKPTILSGSRGVMRANHPDEFLQQFQRLELILRQYRCDTFLVEDFISGTEVALEGLLEGGRLEALALFDKPDPLDGPFFEETIYTTPSRLPARTQAAVLDIAAKAAAALGLRHGPVHAELRIPPGEGSQDSEEWSWAVGGPVMVEIAARSIGGSCGKTLNFAGDRSLEELILAQAFGLPYETRREDVARGVMMIPIPEAGIFLGVDGLDSARAVDLITEIDITAPKYQPLLPIPEGDSYLGFIFAQGDSPDKVEKALRSAHRRLRFKFAPQLRVQTQHGL